MRTLTLCAVLFPTLCCAQVIKQSPTLTLPPVLYAIGVPSSGGYTPEELVKNLEYASKNLDGLIDYLNSKPTDEATYQKYLVRESETARDLIKAGDMMLAQVLARHKSEGNNLSLKLRGHIARAIGIRGANASIADVQLEVAEAQSNVTGFMADLIRLKTDPATLAEDEENTQKWLAADRKYLAEAEARLKQKQSE